MGRVATEAFPNYGEGEFLFRVDARNVLNNPSFDNPTGVITSTIFGRINDSVTNNARLIQLSGKLRF